MFTHVDTAAAVVGIFCALYAQFAGPKTAQDGANALLGFASGAAAAYLLGMAYALWSDGDLLTKMIHTNPVTVFGAFVYGAYINARAVPGLTARDRYRRLYD